MGGNGGTRSLLTACVAACVVAAGCDGGDDGRTPAATQVSQAKGSPARLAERLGELLAQTTSKKDCKPLERISRRSLESFACPPTSELRRSMASLEVTGAAVYGTGAVVDYRSGAADEGAMVMFLDPDRKWAVSRFGLLQQPSAGTSDEESRPGFDRAVAGFLRAARQRDCDLFRKHFATFSADPKAVCLREFQQTRELGQALEASGAPAPDYLGGNEAFGFYALRLAKPEPRYLTISVIKTTSGSLRPFLVLNAAPGPMHTVEASTRSAARRDRPARP